MMRAEQIMALGILAILIQGALAGLLYPVVRLKSSGIKRGVLFGWFLGGFLASYIVLVEPAKYEVPSISAWMLVEGLASFVQLYALWRASGGCAPPIWTRIRICICFNDASKTNAAGSRLDFHVFRAVAYARSSDHGSKYRV